MLVINDFNLLNALLNVLWTVKFDTPPEDTKEIAWSPFVSDIYNQAYDAMIVIARKELRENLAQELEKNRSAENRTFELESVYSHIKHVKPHWEGWTHEQRKNFVQILFSPYKTNDIFLDFIIKNGNDINQVT